jgi:hypothetical protein
LETGHGAFFRASAARLTRRYVECYARWV